MLVLLKPEEGVAQSSMLMILRPPLFVCGIVIMLISNACPMTCTPTLGFIHIIQYADKEC